MTWEHVRFLALLIPTWLVLGAVAVTLSVPVKGSFDPADSEGFMQTNLTACRDPVGVAAQQRVDDWLIVAEQ